MRAIILKGQAGMFGTGVRTGMPRVCLIALALCACIGLQAASDPINAGPLTLEGVQVSSSQPTIADTLVVNGTIKGFRNMRSDWFTILVVRGDEFRDDGKSAEYVARDAVRWNFFAGKAGESAPFKCSVDISGLEEKDYTAILYAQIKTPGKDVEELRVRLLDFKIDNSKLYAAAPLPAPWADDPARLRPLGIELPLDGHKTEFMPIRGDKVFIQDLTKLPGSNLVCQVRNDSKGQWTCAFEALITDAYLRGDKVSRLFTLEAGEARLVSIPLSPRLAELCAESKRGSGRGEARALVKFISGGDIVATENVVIKFRTPIQPKQASRRSVPEERRDDAVWGKLKLIDAVDCAEARPDLEGAKFIGAKYTSEPIGYYGRDSLNFDWQLTYLDKSHDNGFSSIATIFGRKCRTTSNWGWFAYLLGQGKAAKGGRYLVELDYPEDLPRTFCILNNRAESPSFHTGTALGDPYTRQRFTGFSDMPLNGKFNTWRGAVDGADDKIKFSVHSMGDIADPGSAGIAVSAIRLYQIEAPAPYPTLSFPPAPLPKRSIIWLQEDVEPSTAQTLKDLKSYGFTGVAPIYLLYCGKGTGGANMGRVFWNSKLFAPDRFNTRGNTIDESVAAATKLGLDIYPTFEFGGTSLLPEEAYAVEKDGTKAKYYWGTTTNAKGERVVYRVDGWNCVDIAHPAVAEDFNRILDELAPSFKANPAIKGVELTHRFNCWQISWSEFEMARFAKETGVAVPKLPQAEKAKWIAENALDKYWGFFYAKKRENMLAIRDKLQSIRPDLVLHVLNYVADDHLPFGSILSVWANSAKGADEFIDTRRLDKPCLPNFNDHILSIPGKDVRLDMRKLLEDYRRLDQDQPGIHPPLYRQDKGIVVWGPMHYEFTANSPTFLEFFRTGQGLGIYNNIIYNEDCHENLPNAYCPGLEGTEHAGKFSMMEEVMAMAAADPTTLGVRIQSVCRGFPEQGVAFAKAYLALPAIPSVVVESGLKDKDVVIRKIATENGVYFAVINRGFALAGKELALSCFPRDGKMVDLVSGEELDNASGSVRIKLEPMSMRTFVVKKAD